MLTPTCKHCAGWTTLILGVLVLLNVWLVFLSWGFFIGLLLILLGLVKLFVPNKCKACMALQNPQAPSTGRKRR